MAYPDGDEDDMWSLGDAWKEIAKDLESLIPDAKAATDSAQKYYVGEGSEKALAEFAKLYGSGDESLYALVKGLEDLGTRTREAGTEIEYTKIMEAGFAAMTAYSVYALFAAWPWGSAAVPAAIAVGREAITLAAEQGARQLAKQMAAAGMRNAAKVYLKDIAITGLKMGAVGAGLDLGIQSYQVLADHRDHIDPAQAVRTALEWGVGGAVAKGVAPGLTKMLGHTPLSPATRGFLGGGLSGLAGGFGMYGTDIAWQVGDQLTHGGLDWSKVNTTLNPAMLAAGFGMGAAHGVRSAAKPGGANHLPEGTSPHPSATPEGVKPSAALNGEGAPSGLKSGAADANINGETKPSQATDGGSHSRSDSKVSPADESRSGTTESRGSAPESHASTQEARAAAPDPVTRADNVTTAENRQAPVDRNPASPIDNGSRTAAPVDRSSGASPVGAREAPVSGQPTAGERTPSRASVSTAGTGGERTSNISAAQHERPASVDRSAADRGSADAVRATTSPRAEAPAVPEAAPISEPPARGSETNGGTPAPEQPKPGAASAPESTHSPETHPTSSGGVPDHGAPQRENPSLPELANADHGVRQETIGKGSEVDRTPGQIEESPDPVDIATGEFLLPQTDLSLPGVLALVLRRRHRSSYRFGRWFGPSWSATLDMRVVVDAEGVTLLAEDGLMLAYPHADSEVPVGPIAGGQRWTLTRSESGGYRVRDPHRELLWHFAPDAALDGLDTLLGNYAISAITDRHHNRVTFRYDADGAPIEVTHSGGYRVRIDTAAGRVTALTVLGSNVSEADTIVREFGYESGNLVTVRTGTGATTRFTYDTQARITSWTDSNGTAMVNTYDSSGRVVHQRGSAGILNCGFVYEASTDGFRTSITDSLAAITHHGFDHDLRLRRLSDPEGGNTYFDYNPDRKPVRVLAPDGAESRYNYNDFGDLTELIRPDGAAVRIRYAGFNRPSVIFDVDGGVRYQEWSDTGDLIASIDAAGSRTEFTYHPNGAASGVISPTGAQTVVDVDGAGLPVVITDPLGSVTYIERNSLGRVTQVTGPLGETTRYEWSADGKPLRRSDADGHSESWTWDGEGNLLTHTDRANGITHHTYGAFDLLASRTDPDGSTTRYSWDTERRLVAVTNPLAQTWSYEYDRAGRMIAETDYSGATTRYTHDAVGRVATVTAATGVTRTHARDILGRITAITADTGEWLSYRHDVAGRVLTAQSGVRQTVIHALEYGYSSLGQLISQQLDNQAPMRFEYDEYGRRTGRVSPTGARTDWDWDNTGRASAMSADSQSVSFSYDAVGRPTGWQIGAVTVHRDLSPVGRIIDQQVTAVPRPLLNLGLEPASAPDPRMIRRDSYSYRPDGFLSAHTLARSDAQTNHRDFVLDSVGRIATVAENGSPTESYRYDSLNNITAAHNATTGLSTEPDSRREYHNNLLVRDGRTRYYYDRAGRLIRKTKSRLSHKPDIWHYHYNAFDQLTDVQTPDAQWWHYTYDATGRRVTKQRRAPDGTTLDHTDYTWDSTYLVEQSTPAATTRWHYHPGTRTPITQSTDQHTYDRAFYAIITDLVGTPTDLIDPTTGTTVATATSDLWGTTRWQGSIDTPLRFPGQIYDPETSLHYNLHRFYDPVAGRYLTSDPLGLHPGPNSYAYPHNPTAWIDPLGLTPCPTPTYGNGGDIDHISPSEARRIQNAANFRGVTIHVVGSRAAGTANAFSDWDYVITDINSRTKSRIKGSLPMGPVELGYGRRIDIMTGPLVEGEPYITFHPNLGE
ncbi:RHS repeat-associated core domain-containing protein [Nocardia sp. NPDC056000]|uniref:RHS repeat-associated core domain-containing protein n=1 Tax=Nocardia sp. NPDC056000 TaxID=3345674 RepID=UPI0035D9B54A